MKKYRVFNNHDYKTIVHEYDIRVEVNNNNHEVTTLSRSLDDSWSEKNRGEDLISIIDTGDMIIFPRKMFTDDVDYAAFTELYILLSFINKTQCIPLFKGSIEEVVPKHIIEI